MLALIFFNFELWENIMSKYNIVISTIIGIIIAGTISWMLYSIILKIKNINSGSAGAISAFIGATAALYLVHKLQNKLKSKN